MSKHSKHANTKNIMTAHERAQSTDGYGTSKLVLGADSQRPWDTCCLSLTTVGDDPVCTPSGFLYDYGGLVQNLVDQKERYARQRAAYKKQREQDTARAEASVRAEADAATARFRDGQDKLHVVAAPSAAKKMKQSETNFDISNIATDRFKGVEAKVPKPRKGTFCPESGDALKVSQLVHVKLWPLPTPVRPADTSSGRFGCPLCQRVLLNSSTVVVFVDSGHAVCSQCADATKEDDLHRNPFSNSIVPVVTLKKGGTGFVSNSDQKVEVVKKQMAFQFG